MMSPASLCTPKTLFLFSSSNTKKQETDRNCQSLGLGSLDDFWLILKMGQNEALPEHLNEALSQAKSGMRIAQPKGKEPKVLHD